MLTWTILTILQTATAADTIVIEDNIMSDAVCYLLDDPVIAADSWDIDEDVEIPEEAMEEVDGQTQIDTSVIENDIIFLASNIVIEDDVMYAATASVSLNGDDCGFCDGLCVDGKCIMDPCTKPWGR
ncbi:MAG: hypothetical protein AAFV53_42900 [Myxococcota bacterium]